MDPKDLKERRLGPKLRQIQFTSPINLVTSVQAVN
jgi:hypothetical protein